ncbi:UDP-N-acetylmuramoyl-L-alanine--D-glutamate ligase [Oceanisphaera profunda]|uniref:UDP-N-acetylmuramoylalanine--D-glutamate ligase n=1 Tax=Oceanisphaera profunda TaxID=1416627 RepID=A0A1Y0D6Q9_9GAMM|nr:UDP-N-acetylmuramoyl-L-alanine--D-glutamate ligase [Oceanisphaera profunda]ART82887.1 UDP-N-acetylmuramoyl-L-alanine--D-glutamate ligase [Oceanisphaera profunda]
MLPERILILGLGQTGLSVLQYCLQCGITPVVMDTRSRPPGAEQLPDSIERYFGGLELAPLLAAELIVASPGVPLATPELQQALAAGVEIIGDVELLVRACSRGDKALPIIAITGSNGKSTVTTLVGEMAAEAGIKVGVGGNIGTPALELLSTELELVVLELSSFQLETTPSLAASAATVLNISEDHLDRYDSLAHYRDTKLGIYQGAEQAVYNREDDQTQVPTWLSPSAHAITSFGLDDQAYGRVAHDGQLWLSRAGQPVLPVADLKILGTHNQLNALAAMALADQAGISETAQVAVLRRFTGLKHRCQFVAEKNGVLWVNDSKATNVGATLAAIDGLSDAGGRLWLIAGGQGKGQDFSPLVPLLNDKLAAMVCFGQDRAQLLALATNTHEVHTLDEAVAWCAAEATAGDTVLFAPACASLDMYGNYQLRGEHFIKLVEALLVEAL